MTRHALSALLLAGSAAAARELLFVSSYAGTVTTLNGTALSGGAGGNVPAMKAIRTTDGCKASPSWLELDRKDALLYCIDEGLSTPGGSLSSYRTNCDGSLTQLGKIPTISGPVSGTFYGENGKGFAMAH